MRLTTPLDDLFKTGSHVKVLRALHAFPEGAASSGRDLARRAGVSHPTAINVLEHLSEQGVVEVERSSNSYRYRLNGRHLLYSGLARLFAMESEALAGLVEFLADEIATRAGSVTAAYLYGSAARSDMSLGSDLDVLVVCPPRARTKVEEAMDEIGDAVQERYGNTLSTLVETRGVDALLQAHPSTPLWRIISKEGIQILPANRRERNAAAG